MSKVPPSKSANGKPYQKERTEALEQENEALHKQVQALANGNEMLAKQSADLSSVLASLNRRNETLENAYNQAMTELQKRGGILTPEDAG